LVARLHGNRHDRLAASATATRAGATGANVALVDLNGAAEQLASGEHHRAAQLVQPRPRRLIAAQPQDALQAQRRYALLLVDDIPDRREPAHKRCARTRKDRARGDRGFRTTGRAAPQTVTHLPPVAIDHPTEATGEPGAPPQPLEVAQARRLVWKPRQQFMPIARVLDSRPRMLTSHAAKLQPQGDGTG